MVDFDPNYDYKEGPPGGKRNAIIMLLIVLVAFIAVQFAIRALST